MLLDLIEGIKNNGLNYTLISLKRVDIKFNNFTAAIVIRNRYSIYIVQKENIIDYKEGCETVEEVMDSLLDLNMILA